MGKEGRRRSANTTKHNRESNKTTTKKQNKTKQKRKNQLVRRTVNELLVGEGEGAPDAVIGTVTEMMGREEREDDEREGVSVEADAAAGADKEDCPILEGARAAGGREGRTEEVGDVIVKEGEEEEVDVCAVDEEEEDGVEEDDEEEEAEEEEGDGAEAR